MATHRDALTSEESGRDAWLAFGVGVLALVLYLVTLPPSYGMWDTAELQTVAAILGIAHPPGSPAFTLLGYAAVHLFPFGEPAWRVNAMCSCAVALSVALAYAVARRFGAGPVPSAVAALGFGVALVTWRDATRAEILDLALFWRAAALFFGIRWCAAGRVRDVFAMSVATGLACATHGLSLFLLPSVALLAMGRPGWMQPRVFSSLGGGFALGLLPYAYLPLRSAWIDAHHLDPLTTLGLPNGLAFWNYGDPSSWGTFVHFVTGADFHVRGGFAGYVSFGRYPDFAEGVSRQIAQAYGYAGTMLALGGALVLLWSRRLERIAIVLAGILPVPYTIAYPDLQDRERYYLLGLWCAAVAMAVGFERLTELFQLRGKSIGRYVFAFALAVSFATVGPERAQLFGQRADLTGPDFVAQVRAFTPEDAIVMADWSYATPLAYARYVAGSFGRRTVIAAFPQQYLAYAARWVRTRPVYFVGFEDDLALPGWRLQKVKSGDYYAYRLSK
jgi:hypothetical protein